MSTEKPSPITPRTFNFWQKLIVPPDVADLDQRLLSQLLSSSLLVTFLLLVVLFVLRQPFGVATEMEVLVRIILGIATAAGYFLSRSGHYRLSARLMIATGLVVLFALSLIDNDTAPLNYLPVVILFGSLFLSLPEMVFTAIFLSLALAGLPAFSAQLSLREIIDGPLSLNATLIVFTLLITYYRSYLEKSKRSQLELTKLRYQTIADSAYDWIYWEGPDGSYQYVSPSCERILGYTSEEWIANPDLLLEHIHPEDKDKWLEHRELAATSLGLHDVQFRIFHKDGEIRWIEHVCQPVQDENEGFMGFRASNRDITARLQAQEQLQNLSTAVEQSPANVVITDTNGNIKYVNPRFTETTGYSPEEVIGKNPRVLKSGQTPAETYEDLWKTLKAGREWHGEFANKNKNGEIYWEHASISPVKNKEGVTTHYVAVKEDITERKRVEKELQAYREQLEDLVDERTATLRSANSFLEAEITERKRIEQALRESERFALSTLDGLSAHIAIVGDTGDILAVNQAWRDFAAANSIEVSDVCEGANYLNVCDSAAGFSSYEAAEFAAGIRAVLAGKEQTYLMEYPCHSPTVERWFVGRVTRFPGDGPPRVVVAHENITERKQIEEALRQSEERYRLLAETTRDIILLHDMEGVIHYVNQAGVNFGGLEVGKSIMDFVSADFMDEVVLRHKARETGDQDTYLYETAFVNREGRQVPIEVNASPIEIDGEIQLLLVARDITERKQADEALRASEERYRYTLDNMLEGCQIISHDWRYLYVNDAAARQGHRTKEQMLGHTIMDIYADIESANLLSVLQKCMDEHISDQMVNEFTYSDGSRGWFELSIQPVPEGLFVLSNEITKRKLAEEALRESQRMLSTLISNLPGVAYRCFNDKDWEMEFISDGCLAMTGYQPDDFVHNQVTSWADVIHPDDRQMVWEDIQAAIDKDRPFQLTYRIVTRSGTEKWVWEQGRQVQAPGNAIYLEGFISDITGRMRAEEALRHERDLMHILMDNVPDAIYFKDTEGQFTRVNKAQAWLLGCETPEDALGKTVFDFYTPEFAQEASDDDQRIIETTQALIGKTEQPRWKDGRSSWVSTTKVPIRDNEAQINGIVGISRDITERIQAEEVLTHRVRQLELINRVSQEITAELSLDDVLSKAVQLIHESFGYPHIGVFLLDHEQDELVMKGQAGTYASLFPSNHRLKLSEGINGWVARNGQRLMIGDVRAEPRYYNPFPEQLILSELSVPLKWSHEVIGVLDIQSDQLDAFDKDDALVLDTLADQLATAIQNSSLFERTQKALEELIWAEAAEHEQRTLAEALSDVAAKFTSTLDLEEVLEHVMANLGRVAQHDSASVMLIESGVARVVSHQGRADLESGEVTEWVIAETPTLKQMVESRESLVISEIKDSSLWIPSINWVRSYAGAPIRLDEEVIGFINLNGAAPDMFTADHARRLQAFTDQAAIAIKNAQLYHKLTVHSEILEQAVRERTAELQNTKERVEAILTYSPDPILLLKPNGSLEAANPAFQQVFGYHIDQLYGQPPTTLITSEYTEAMEEALKNATHKREVARLELVAKHQDGTTFDVGVALAPIQVGDTLLGVVCNVRDISALKEVERMKDAFVSNVSHELRTPITSLKLSYSLLEMDPDGREKYMGRLVREINRLNSLIEDLLRLSRLDQGRVELNLEPVDLNIIAVQYVNDRSLLAEDRDLALLFEGDSDIPLALADEGLSGQVLSILLTNALNYTPAGGRITVSTHQEENDGKQWVGFSVSDTGPGITPDDQLHLFERFYRGQAGHDSGAPGTGLGLAIAQEIVELHHGRIEVESDGVPGKGSKFTIWLPTGS